MPPGSAPSMSVLPSSATDYVGAARLGPEYVGAALFRTEFIGAARLGPEYVGGIVRHIDLLGDAHA